MPNTKKAGNSRRLLPVEGLVQSSVWARRVAKVLVWLMGVATSALLLLPWQQTSRASGRVTAYVPQQRMQPVTAQAEGVVSRIADGIIEGSLVKAGDTILWIEPLAAGLPQQLEQQVAQVDLKIQFAEAKVKVLNEQRETFELARDYAVEAADQIVLSAGNKLAAKQQELAAYQATEAQAKLDFDRQSKLVEEGIRSERDFEKIRADYQKAAALLAAAEKEVQAAINEVTAKEKEREQKKLEAQTKVDYAMAMVQQALGEAASYQKERLDLTIKLQELQRMEIKAPLDGTILRLPIFVQGQQIKKGDELFTIVPDSTQDAVELFVMGNDLPLVKLGAEVRLQFEGWPAVQFVGWPSIAVGSFGGKVAAIDATDDGSGQFRILVLPAPDQPEWPQGVLLRQGVRANGWVMLGQVPLWFELWRQLNGFPPGDLTIPQKQEKPAKVPGFK